MAVGTGDHCESFEPASRMAQATGGNVCESCEYWFPFSTMPRVGECENPSSRHFGMPAFSDKTTEECFVRRSLEGLEFMWCQTHRETIHSSDLALHKECRLFPNAAALPVEEQVELTLAGD